MNKWLLGLVVMLGLFIAPTMACKQINFYTQNNASLNDNICVDIDQKDSNTFTMQLDDVNSSATGLRCMLLIGNTNFLYDVGACNGTFDYDGEDVSKVKIYARIGTDGRRGNYESYYDFNDGSRTSSIDGNDNTNDNTNDGELDNFSVNSDTSSPSLNSRLDITIKARDNNNNTIDNYADTVRFKVYRKSSSSSTWTDITSSSSSSSYYELGRTYYNFTTADDGDVPLDNLVKFTNENYDYRLRVYAADNSSIYGEKTFYFASDTADNELDTFYVYNSPSTPAINSWIDVSIEARGTADEVYEDYNGTVKFKVYKRSSSSSTWGEITATSSSYYDIDETSYDFTNSDNGYATLDNLIKFKNSSYDYKIRVYDDDTNTYGEKTFYFKTNNSSTNADLNNFYLYNSPSSPGINEWIDISIKARDASNNTIVDYDDTVKFKVYKRTSSSATRGEITANSSYYLIDMTSYDFTSSDDGEVVLDNLIKFTNNAYDYKLRVYDAIDDDIYTEKIFYIRNAGDDNNTDTDLDSFSVTSSPTSATINTRVDIAIAAQDANDDIVTDYADVVKFKVYKKTASSNTWGEITSSASNYYTISKTSYDFTTSDDGEKNITDLIKFTNSSYDYKLRVYDSADTDIYGEKTFYFVGDANDDNDTEIDNFYVYNSKASSPIKDTRYDVTIRARANDNTKLTDYTNIARFEVYRKSSNSSTWTKISTSASTYYVLGRDYYDFNSSDKGEATIDNLIKFVNSNYDYKLRVYDDDKTTVDGEEIFYFVGDQNNEDEGLDNFYVYSSPSSPAINTRADITIKARDNSNNIIEGYNGTARFKVYRKAASASSWTEITSSASNYYTIDDTSYDFTTSDDGEVTLDNLIKFTNSSYNYKLVVYDEDNDNIDGEKIFYFDGNDNSNNDNDNDNDIPSNIDGFSASEFIKIQKVYSVREIVIDNLSDKYSSLRNSSTWKDYSETLLDNMRDIVYDDSNREYADYDEFLEGFMERYNYTIQRM